jgi:hypothetical protein
MHVYVQKLNSTTFPRSDFAFSGLELSQPRAPPKSGIDGGLRLCEKSNAPSKLAAIANRAILMVTDFSPDSGFLAVDELCRIPQGA